MFCLFSFFFFFPPLFSLSLLTLLHIAPSSPAMLPCPGFQPCALRPAVLLGDMGKEERQAARFLLWPGCSGTVPPFAALLRVLPAPLTGAGLLQAAPIMAAHLALWGTLF